MIKVEKDGKKFQIDVLDYEFPNREDTGGIPTEQQLEEMGGRDYDANWLNIGFECYDKKYEWKAVDPCLLSWELEDLMDWFVNLAEDRDVENAAPQMAFTEPCFGILQKRLDENNFKLRFVLAYETAPPEEYHNGEYFMDFVLSRQELADIANNIAMAAAAFPER